MNKTVLIKICLHTLDERILHNIHEMMLTMTDIYFFVQSRCARSAPKHTISPSHSSINSIYNMMTRSVVVYLFTIQSVRHSKFVFIHIYIQRFVTCESNINIAEHVAAHSRSLQRHNMCDCMGVRACTVQHWLAFLTVVFFFLFLIFRFCYFRYYKYFCFIAQAISTIYIAI